MKTGSLNDGPLVVALIAPAGCGKTVYLAALHHLSTRAAHSVGKVLYRVHHVSGYGPNPQAAKESEEQLRLARAMLLDKGRPERTTSFNTYRISIELLRPDEESIQRTVFVIDAQGGNLFPGIQGLDAPAADPDSPTLGQILRELKFEGARLALLTFVNEPLQESEDWRMHHDVPAGLAAYLKDQRVRRVAYYVACADGLYPRLGDLRRALGALNVHAEDQRAWCAYRDHFLGSPHYRFAVNFLNYLHHSRSTIGGGGEGADGEDHEDEASFAMFWGSSLGVQRETGRPNVAFGPQPGRLLDPKDWNPLQVLEPILWAADLYPHSGARHASQ